MASPRSTATFTTANSHFELEDTSNNNTTIQIDTMLESEMLQECQPETIDTQEQVPEQDREEPQHTSDMRSRHSSIHQEPPSPVAQALRQDFDFGFTGGRDKEVTRSYEQVTESRAKAQYYSKAFATREQPNTVRERLVRTSVISAEFKTNVIIQDEYTFLTTMSAFLAARYNRPESSIMITLNHSVCMLFGGSFDPAYLLTISAVSEQIKPVLNRRNAALIQRFLAEEIQVPSDRGILKFQGIAEDDLANSGITLAAEIEQDTRSSATISRPSSEGFSLRKLNSNKKRSMRQSQAKMIIPTPPASPPRELEKFDLEPQRTHNRSVSDATTSSNPEIDVLKGHMSQVDMSNFDWNKSKPGKMGKKSGFFRKLVT